MATDTVSRAAGAQSPAVPESVIRAAAERRSRHPAHSAPIGSVLAEEAAEAPSPQVFLELDELLQKLLNVISHLRCADSGLYDLQSVPAALQPAAIVLHDAIENLAALHSRMEEWAAEDSREARYAGAAEAHDARDAELPEALAQHVADQQHCARELQDLLAAVLRDPNRNDDGILSIAWREARALNGALDRASLIRAIEGQS
jgi:hypothetical protein